MPLGRDDLHRADVDAGTGGPVGNAGIGLGFGDLGFAQEGTLSGFQGTGPDLVTADIDTWVATSADTAAVPTVSSLDVNPEDSFPYAIGAFTGEPFRIDPATAATANLGVPTGLPNPDNSQDSLATFAVRAPTRGPPPNHPAAADRRDRGHPPPVPGPLPDRVRLCRRRRAAARGWVGEPCPPGLRDGGRGARGGPGFSSRTGSDRRRSPRPRDPRAARSAEPRS